MEFEFPIMNRVPVYPLNVSKKEHKENYIDLGMGNPDMPPNDHIIQELVKNSRMDNNYQYAPSAGILSLRRSICDWYLERYGVLLDPETESIVTIGSKEGITHLAMATLTKGDTVIVPDPTYPVHTHAFTIAGAEVIRVPLLHPNGFLKEIVKTIKSSKNKPKIILVNFPSNPTGMCVDISFYEELVSIANKYDIWVIQDFAYANIAFDGYSPPSILQVEGAKHNCVEFYSLSKSYNMAGCRVGFMCGNTQLVKALKHIKSYLDYGMFRPIQLAANIALSGPQECVEDVVAEYKKRRDCLCNGLRKLGWEVSLSKATMFVWAKIPELYKNMNSQAFTQKMLQDAFVIVTPGSAFGEKGEGYVRFSLITNTEKINKVLESTSKMMQVDSLTYDYVDCSVAGGEW